MLTTGFRLTAATLTVVLLGISPAAAGSFDVGARIGDSTVRVNNGGVSARIKLGTGPYHRGLKRRSADRVTTRTRRGTFDQYRDDDYHHRRGRLIVVPVRERTIIQQVPVAVPPEPQQVIRIETPPQPVAPQTLDPQGSARTVTARGRAAAAQEYELGAVLPANQPHVILDHRRYGLPVPPSGQIYARVGRDVLRINPDTRRIIAVVAN